MIEATWLGGPWDGRKVKLDHPNRSLRVPLPLPPASFLRADTPMTPDIRYIEVRPRCTASGWVLPWKEGK